MDNNLDLKQKCLLELSGELPPAARKELIHQISNDPEACNTYESVRENYSLLDFLPFVEPSAAERRAIPATIKQLVHGELMRPAIQARRGRLLIRCAAMITIVAMIGTVAWGMVNAQRGQSKHYADQMARITAATDRLAAAHKPGAYELAINDLAASIRQLETESPTLSDVYDRNLGNLLDALASVPQVYDTGDWAGDDWSTRY
jgi:hypothetical protein